MTTNKDLLFTILLSIAFWGSCHSEKKSPNPEASPNAPVKLVKKSFEAMGTLFNFTFSTALSDDDLEKATNDAFKEILRIETMMSTYKADSVVSEVNRQAGNMPVPVPKELFELIERAIGISTKTSGKFDISFGPLGKLWNFKKSPPTIPKKSDLDERTSLVDYRQIQLDQKKQTVFLGQKGMSIGLGAIAKGYGVDRASQKLRNASINDFIVYGGGDIYFSGKKGTRPWRVGIQDPRNKHHYFANFPVKKSGAVVTSGDYEKFFIKDGHRYHHIIDPATGYPADKSISVTVVTEHAADADALATGIFILGPEKGMTLIESTPNLEGVIVGPNLKVHVSSGLKPVINITSILNEESP